MKVTEILRRLVSGVWLGLDTVRRVLHLILLVVIFAVVLAGVAGRPVVVPDSAALVVDPEGELVEQLAGDPLDRALGEVRGDGVHQVLVRDLVDSIEAAATDARIKAVVLRLDLLDANGLPMLKAITRAIDKVRAAGKEVVALGDSFDKGQYYLATHADKVLLNDLGMVFIDGYGYYRMYFRGALEKLRVDLNVFRVGEYKSFVEPFIRDGMSEEDKSASRQWLKAMWSNYQRDVVAARKLQPGSLDDYANNFPSYLQAADGSASRVALDRGLVDDLMSRQEFRDYMIDRVGEGNDTDTGYNSIDYRQYLLAIRRGGALASKSENVGIIVASGQITDGEAPPGEIGGDTLAALVHQAAEDDSLKAIVLRVDSPGGSMFASEVVLDELRNLKATGKPLVVSMGSVAASGGYYISMAADEIWADDSTITGSIGVGAIVPTVNRGLDALGIHVDGIGTTDLAGQLQVDRPLGDAARSILQQSVQDAYRIFVTSVADARSMTPDKVDAIARGRVWIGSDAKNLGLVDSLGDLPGAIEAAARRAGLEEGAYGIEYVEPELPWASRWLEQYIVRLVVNLRHLGITLPRWGVSSVQRFVTEAGRSLDSLRLWNDPRGIYLICECDK